MLSATTTYQEQGGRLASWDPTSVGMYAPASQYIALPHRLSDSQFSTQPSPPNNLATNTPTLAPPRRTRASKPKGKSTFRFQMLRGAPLTPSR